MAAPRQTRRKTTKASSPEVMGPDHEALLLTAYQCLPNLIASELHSVEPLNAALRALADRRREEVEVTLSKLDLPADQVAILRAVPELQFGDAGIPRPEVILGRTLYRRVDGRGNRKNVPDAICVLDFCVQVQVPTWSTGYLSIPSRGEDVQLKEPADAVHGLGLGLKAMMLPGLVFTSAVTVGQAVHEIERVSEAARIDSVHESYTRPTDPFVICVTDHPGLAEILRDKVDVMWVDDDDIDEVNLDMGFLASTITVNSY